MVSWGFWLAFVVFFCGLRFPWYVFFFEGGCRSNSGNYENRPKLPPKGNGHLNQPSVFSIFRDYVKLRGYTDAILDDWDVPVIQNHLGFHPQIHEFLSSKYCDDDTWRGIFTTLRLHGRAIRLNPYQINWDLLLGSFRYGKSSFFTRAKWGENVTRRTHDTQLWQIWSVPPDPGGIQIPDLCLFSNPPSDLFFSPCLF